MKRNSAVAVFSLGLGILGLGSMLPAASAETLTVPNPYTTIQAAVDAAIAGDVVVVDPGTYSDPVHEAGGGDTTHCCVVMKSGITLRGAGIDQTIIDANSQGRGIHMANVTDATISGLTIRNSKGDNYGSGMVVKNSSPHVFDVKVEDGQQGGISLTHTSSGTFEDCIFHNNSGKYGAGIDVEQDCTPSFFDCEITGNSGPSNAGVQIRGSASLVRCVIDGNTTAGASPGGVSGGGLGVLGGAPTISYCTISNNYSGGEGGGISYMSNDPGGLIEGCMIRNNQCAGTYNEGGGIMVSSLADLQIRGCTIRENEAIGTWGNGGGIFVSYSTVNMSDCTFYANSAASVTGLAGNIGLEVMDSPPWPLPITIDHCIIAASPDGMGVWCEADYGWVTMSCCDVYGNADGDGFVGTATDCFSLDPLLCDPPNGNLHVDEASPCAPGNHPSGAETCGGLLIGAWAAGCDAGIDDPPARSTVALLGNQPNPFTRATVISFSLGRSEHVSLEVIDLNGRRVALLVDASLPAGIHHVDWDGTLLDGGRAASGAYFYRLRSGGLTEAMRMLRLR